MRFKSILIMALPDIFNPAIANQIIGRIQSLHQDSIPRWGKMNVAQMLAHCNITYEMVYTDLHAQPGKFMTWVLKLWVKPTVISEKPYAENGKTAPAFLVHHEQDFHLQKQRLIDYINKVVEEGRVIYEGKSSHSFGVLTAEEWNNMFYKHLDHHLRQFNV